MPTLNLRAPAAVLAAALALSGCGTNLGPLGEILEGIVTPAGQQQGQLSAEIQSVDTRQQVIRVITQDGQAGPVLFDQSTVVVYRQQQYPVTALERGDIVLMQVQQDARNNLYASRIDVQQSARERAGQGPAQVQQFTGRVGQINQQQGLFQLQTQNMGTIVVSLPYNPPSTVQQRFSRLRTGDNVRIEGTVLSSNRVELHRFF